jgi:hypothetical protein
MSEIKKEKVFFTSFVEVIFPGIEKLLIVTQGVLQLFLPPTRDLLPVEISGEDIHVGLEKIVNIGW